VTITPEAGRVLGCLVEKQLTTPQQYPLTANALLLACNQTTNRDPVVTMDDNSVMDALLGLKEQHLVRFVLPSHGRSVTRYRHVLDEAYGIDVQDFALLAVLLVHGPQTPGELRARADRMTTFSSIDPVLAHLERMATSPEGLVELLPRRPGQKEDRWQQLLAERWVGTDGPTDDGQAIANSAGPNRQAPNTAEHTSPAELAELKAEVAELRSSLAELEASVAELRQSLGG
jgi:uncharacterized protein YceH (UPF0502 family)